MEQVRTRGVYHNQRSGNKHGAVFTPPAPPAPTVTCLMMTEGALWFYPEPLTWTNVCFILFFCLKATWNKVFTFVRMRTRRVFQLVFVYVHADTHTHISACIHVQTEMTLFQVYLNSVNVNSAWTGLSIKAAETKHVVWWCRRALWDHGSSLFGDLHCRWKCTWRDSGGSTSLCTVTDEHKTLKYCIFIYR